MRKMQVLICGLLLVISVACRAQITAPGWYNGLQGTTISFPSTTTAPQPASLSTAAQVVKSDGAFQPLTQQGQSNTSDIITPDIQALADGLHDDPLQIYKYVHDHIRYVLYFGSKKGAELTLLEKSGNDFDQSSLLVALLRAAGYSPVYGFGWTEVPYDNPDGSDRDLHHWLQLKLINSNWGYTSNYLRNLFANLRGYPTLDYLSNYQYDTNTFLFQRVWVGLTIGSTNYFLDAAFKVSEPVTNTVNLASAMQYSSNSIMSVAQGTDNGSSVYGLNEGNVRGALTGYTANLLSYLQSNSPNTSLQQVLGGWQIVAATNTSLPTSLPFYTVNYPTLPAMNLTNWNEIPTNLMATLSISFAGTNSFWLMPQLNGSRLSLTFDTNGLAQLWQDDSLLAQQATSGSNSRTNVVLVANQPFGTWNFYNNTLIPGTRGDLMVTNSYQRTNATYALTYAFDPDWGWLQERENQLDNYREQGLPDSSRQVTSETLNIMGLNWMLQTENSCTLLARQIGILPLYHTRLGRMAQEGGNGYYVDVYMQLDGSISDSGWDTVNVDKDSRYFNVDTYFASALEYGLIEQLQNTNLVGASTVKMLEIASTNSQTIYLAQNANWSTIQNSIANYGSADKTRIGNLISQGYYVLLPQNGSNHVAGAGSWAGCGYVGYLPGSTNVGEFTTFAISGGYNGGYSSQMTATINVPFQDETDVNQPGVYQRPPINTDAPATIDPLDTADGTFQIENADLSLGTSEPRGITLSRYYNGTRRFSNPSGMAAGWIHNYTITANNVAAPQAGLGQTTPEQAAPMLVASCAAIGLYNDLQPDAKNWMVATLIAKWAIDQLDRNGVSVGLGKDTVQFVGQPNGVYTPPANCSMTLIQTNGVYWLQQRHANTFQFNSAGYLASIVDQYGQSLNLAYNSSNWVKTVTDWKNRQLTFNYSGAPLRLRSVSDGTRTVNYGYSTANSPQGDLTTFTDAEGQTNSYQYDTNHQIVAMLDPLNRLVVSNNYDSLGHVATQLSQGDPNKTWHIYWSGWLTAEVDPAGGETDYYYDDQARLVAVKDPLEHETDRYYDGQNHVIATVSPLGELRQFVFDGNNNLVYSIDPLGFTNQLIYDSQNNLIRSIDPLGNPTTFGYNAQFSLTGQTNGAGDWVSFAYNTDGTLHSHTDAGGTTTIGYDSFGQVNSIGYPGGLGAESFVNNSLGKVTSHTDARGFVTAFQYNNRLELTNTVAPTNLTVSVSYDAADNIASTTDGRRNATTNTWSATRQPLATTLPAMAAGIPVFTNLYDNRDWLARSLDPLQAATVYTNNSAGWLVSQTDPLQRTTTLGFDADGRQIAATNAVKEATLQSWDARGKPIALTDAAQHTSFRSYDAAGNLIILTNRNGKIWRFQYDGANRLTNTITPLLRNLSQTWNHQGLVSSTIDPSNRPAYFYYDAKGRLTNRTDNIGAVLYSYDGNDNRTNVNGSGLINVWTYDAYNRVSTYTDAYGNLIQYRYDANGNLTNLIYPGGKNVFYAFDNDNHLVQVKDWSGRLTTLTYDLAGRLITITRPNNTFRTLNYDAAGELTNIWEQMVNDLPIAWLRYNWNSNSTIAWEFGAPLPHTNAPASRTMTYNDDNQLTTVDRMNVTVDLVGNLTYGPLTNDSFASYVFDVRNRLLTAGGVTNAYDALNNRIGETYGTNSVAYVVNPNARLPQVLMRIKNGVTNYYIYGGGLLYQVTETATGTNTLTYHYDSRGSTIALTTDSGLVVDRFEYSLYGTLTYRAGADDTPFLFNGRFGVMSDPNGLLCMRARYYNPFLCRFLSADPSHFDGGLNWYAYANGNPVSYLDPFGLCASSQGPLPTWLTMSSADYAQFTAYQQIAAASANANEDTLGNAAGLILDAWAEHEQDLDAVYRNQQPITLTAGNQTFTFQPPRYDFAPLGVGAIEEFAAEGDMVTVTHFTDAQTVANIQNGTGTLNAGSFVTLPSEVAGMNASQVETALEIDAGKGAYSATFQTPAANLGPAFNGPLTSGGKIQFQLINPTPPGPFVPTPP